MPQITRLFSHVFRLPSYSICCLIALICFTSSCRKDFDTIPSQGNLRFSQDTVYLDTVFSGISSSTYQVTVYNDSRKDISIPSIQLNQGNSSRYRLNVDGIPGKSFQNIEILAQDSILIFIEATAQIHELAQQATQYLYTDQLLFDNGLEQQKIELVTLLQDAHFLYPQKFNDGSTEALTIGTDENGNPIQISGFFLDDSQLHFTADKPYVIYGYAAVPPQKTLNIDPGVRVHFHTNGGLIVANQASLHVNGLPSSDPKTLENEVIFQGDRLEPDYANTPGQWQTIWLTAGSTDNHFQHTTIKNATVGIRTDAHDNTNNPTLLLENTQIYNCATVGLWATTGHVTTKNVVINNCGQAALYLSLGGKYNFYNSTFVNYWTNGYRDFPAVLIENYYQTPEQTLVADLEAANFYNCIIYGNQNIELVLSQADQADFKFNFHNSIIRFDDYSGNFADNPLYNFDDTDHYINNLINQNPLFLNPQNNQLRIDNNSPANALADPTTATQVDLLGSPRGSQPDAGAYESSPFPQDTE